jgi:hypothetical protein
MAPAPLPLPPPKALSADFADAAADALDDDVFSAVDAAKLN